ncbi:hypothetical protein V5799_016690, partial [Amblyomma americanum]
MACEGSTRPNPDFLFHPVRTVNVTVGGESVSADSVNLVAASSRFGLIFAGFDQGVKICTLEDIQNCDAEEGPNSKAPAENCPFRLLPTTGPVLLVALNADDTTLAVGLMRDGVPVADMYDVRGFGGQTLETRPIATVRLSTLPDVALQDFSWNPVACDMFAVCLNNGSVSIYELSGEALTILGTLPPSVGGTALCWSPKGKQLVVGKKDGSLSQYKPNMQEAKSHSSPTLFENSVSVVSVCWLAPTAFAVVYASATSTEDSQANLVTITFSKTSPITYTNFGEPCYKSGQHPRDRFWLYHQPDWGILVCMSRNSIESAVLGCKSADKMQWELWELDSHGRAEVPLRRGEEAYPLGLAVSYNAQRRITSKMESWAPMPILLVLSTCGGLSPFHIKNLSQGVPSLVRVPEPLLPAGQRKPMANPPQLAAQQTAQVASPTTSTGFLPVGHAAATPVAPLGAAAASRVTAHRKPSVGSATAPQLIGSGNGSFAPVATSAGAPAPTSLSGAGSTSLFSSLPASSTAMAFSFGSSANNAFSFGTTGGGQAFSFAPASSAVTVSKSTPALALSGTSSSAFFSTPAPSFATATTTVPAAPPLSMAFSTPTASSAATPAAPAFGIPASAASGASGLQFKLRAKTDAEAPGGAPQVPTILPTPSQPVVAQETSAQEANTALLGASAPKGSTPAATAPASPPSEEPCKAEPSEDAIIATMNEEIVELGREMEAFKKKVLCRAIEPAGSDAGLMKMKKLGVALESTAETLRSDMEKTHVDVHTLRSLVFETFALLEEARTRDLRNRDPQYAGLLRDRGLDPVAARRLAEARRLRHYVQEQLREVHARLDLDWREHVDQLSSRKRTAELSTAEAIYRALRDIHNTAELLSKTVGLLGAQLNRLRVVSKHCKTLRPCWDESSILNREEEVAALADSLLLTSLSASSARATTVHLAKPNKVTLSAEKKNYLAEFFGQREVTTIEPRVIDKHSESRLLSRLAVVMEESFAKDQAAKQQASQAVTQAPMSKPAQTQQQGLVSTPSTPVKPTALLEARDNIPTPKAFVPAQGATQSFLTSTPLVRTEGVASSGTSSGVPLIRAVPTEQHRMPETKVIEVSVQASGGLDYKSSAVPPTVFPAGLTVSSLAAAPPEISSAAVTNVVTKPLPTRSETTVTTKEAGSPSPFTSPFVVPPGTQPGLKFKLPGQTTSDTLPFTSAFSFGPATTTSASSAASATVLSFAKPSGTAAPTATSSSFKFGDSTASKPGFMAVKPLFGPSFTPVSQPTGLQTGAPTEKKTEATSVEAGEEEPAYEDITPPGSPTPDQEGEEPLNAEPALSLTKDIPVSLADTSVPAVPSAAVFSFTSATTGGSPSLSSSTSAPAPLFQQGFGQPVTTAAKSLFGNSSMSSSASGAAAAFSFTAAKDSPAMNIFATPQVKGPGSGEGQPNTTQAKSLFGNSSVSSASAAAAAFSFTAAKDSPAMNIFAIPQVKGPGSGETRPPSGTVLAVKDNSSKDAVKAPLMFGPSGPSALKPPASATGNTAVSGAEATVSKSPFQPVSSAASQPEIFTLTTTAASAQPSDAQTLSAKTPTSEPSKTDAMVAAATTAAIAASIAASLSSPTIATSVPASAPASLAVSTPSSIASTQAAVIAAELLSSTPPSSPQPPSTPSEVVAPTSCSGTVLGLGSSSVFGGASLPKTPATVLFGQQAVSTAPVTPTSFSFGSVPTSLAGLVSQAPATLIATQPTGQTATSVIATPMFGQAAGTTMTTPSSTPAQQAFSIPQMAVASSAGTLPFGSQLTTTTSSALTFGQVAATTAAAVSTPSVFGQPAAAGASMSAMFGTTTSSATSPTSTPSLFGQNRATFTSSTTTTTTAPFWNPVASGATIFGQPAGQSIFGQAPTSAASSFGQQMGTTPAFGQPGGFTFGQSPVVSSSAGSSPFGQIIPATASGGTSSSLFGQKSSFGTSSGQTPSLFGQQSLFGQSSTPAFGQPQAASGFGQQSQDQQQQGGGSSLFGTSGSGFLSGLGSKPAADAPNKNVFGGSSTFSSSGQTSNLFGNQGASSFGSSTFGSAVGAGTFSGGGSFSMTAGSVAQSGFGAFQQQQQQQQTPTKA